MQLQQQGAALLIVLLKFNGSPQPFVLLKLSHDLQSLSHGLGHCVCGSDTGELFISITKTQRMVVFFRPPEPRLLIGRNENSQYWLSPSVFAAFQLARETKIWPKKGRWPAKRWPLRFQAKSFWNSVLRQAPTLPLLEASKEFQSLEDRSEDRSDRSD